MSYSTKTAKDVYDMSNQSISTAHKLTFVALVMSTAFFNSHWVTISPSVSKKLKEQSVDNEKVDH